MAGEIELRFSVASPVEIPITADPRTTTYDTASIRA